MHARSFGAALVIFTRLPVGAPLDAADFRRGVWHLPLLAFLYSLLQLILTQMLPWSPGAALTAALLLALPIVLGGGLHEDGLADFCDAMGGGSSPEKRLEIMKDPRIGTYGMLGLMLVLGLQFLCLQAIASPQLIPALLISQVTARGFAVSLIVSLPYVQQTASRAGSYLPTPGLQRGFFYSGLWVVASWFLLPKLWMAGALLLLLGGSHLLWTRYLQRRLGGYTGDCLGAAIKIMETLILLLASCLWPRL